jgi:hypothetical protein
LKVEQEEIWGKISAPGIVHQYHPFCKENPVLVWNGVESVDEIIYENDRVFRREFNAWHNDVGYDLKIIDNERIAANVFWRINKVDDGLYELKITLKHRLDGIFPKVPQFLRWIAYYAFIHRQMKSYLNHVLQGFEYYMTTGNTVKPNQFGTHPYFSKK